ncbi:MAG: hypothetical protein COB75_03270 [Idiomarina sp.]|nr:MAG: hypothetical protein COB75_03270 [Idiomarina sp.]
MGWGSAREGGGALVIDTPYSRDARKYVPVGLVWRHPWRQTPLAMELFNHLAPLSPDDPAPTERKITVNEIAKG